jgi:hypothetical protein
MVISKGTPFRKAACGLTPSLIPSKNRSVRDHPRMGDGGCCLRVGQRWAGVDGNVLEGSPGGFARVLAGHY